MGILNVTLDSFYDGGSIRNVEDALNLAAQMLKDGASIIDVGGESTRPGHKPVATQQEIDRIGPVVEAIARELDTPISIDTTKAAVASVAFQVGAHIVNDIWGLQGDPAMADVVAGFDAGVVVMHNRHGVNEHLDILADINDFFTRSLDIAGRAGIRPMHLMLDPGIGFGKTSDQNLRIIAHLECFRSHGLPILIGVSRKSFIGDTIGNLGADRLPGTIAANLRAVQGGAQFIRVHDVGACAQALRIWKATTP